MNNSAMTTINQSILNTRLARLVLTSLLVSVLTAVLSVSQAPTASAETPPRDFFGTVLSAEDGVLVVSTEDAIFEVMVTSTTAIRLPLNPNPPREGVWLAS